MFGVAPRIGEAHNIPGSLGTDICTIVPLDENSANLQGVKYIQLAPKQVIWEISADWEHFYLITRSIEYLSQTAMQTPAQEQVDCPAITSDIPSIETSFGKFHIVETAVAQQPESVFRCDLYPFVSGGQLKTDFFETALAYQLAKNNEILSLFSYQLKKADSKASTTNYCNYQLYNGQSVILDQICSFSSAKFNQQNFAMLVNGWSKQYLLTDRGLEETKSAFLPSMLKSPGYPYFTYSRKNLVPWVGFPTQVEIWRDQILLDVLAIPPYTPATDPVLEFDVWQGDWYLQLKGVVFRNGENWNREMGLDWVDGWHLVAGSPLFLYHQNGQFGVGYLDQDKFSLPLHYDDVYSEKMCCALGFLSLHRTDNGAAFFALRDGIWWWVTVTLSASVPTVQPTPSLPPILSATASTPTAPTP